MIPHNKTPDSTLSVLDKRTIKVNFHIFRVWRTPAYLFCHRLYTFLSPLHRAGRVYGHGSMYNLLCRPQHHLPYCVPPTMKKGDILLSSLLLAVTIGFSAPYPLLKLTPKDQCGYILWTKLSNIFFHHFTF
jgi:hypothetical protein